MVQFRLTSQIKKALPKPLLDLVDWKVGDVVEGSVKDGTIVLTPQSPETLMTPAEKRALSRARKKIAQINKDMIHSKGLTRAEIEAAAKAGLIDPDQKYFWTEEWQKGERKVEWEIKEGKLGPACSTIEEALDYLHHRVKERGLK